MERRLIIRKYKSRDISRYQLIIAATDDKKVNKQIYNDAISVNQINNILINDKDYLLTILKEGSDFATCTARKTLSKVYRKIGLVQR